jgi:hypothetical protein
MHDVAEQVMVRESERVPEFVGDRVEVGLRRRVLADHDGNREHLAAVLQKLGAPDSAPVGPFRSSR